MDTVWLIDFLTLAETGSFSRAADQRNLTQPAFSRRIRALEDWLGASLFDRSMVPVTLTEPGRQFVTEARKLVDGIEAARRLVQEAALSGSSALSLASTDALASGFAPSLLQRLNQETGRGLVKVIIGSARDTETMLMRGQCQFLIRHQHGPVPARIENEQLLQAVVARDLLLPVCSPALMSRLLNDGPETAMPILAHDAANLFGQVCALIIASRMAGVFHGIEVVSQSTALLHAMVLRGAGLAWLPLSLIQDDLRIGRLQTMPDPSWREPLDILLVRNAAPGSRMVETLWKEMTAGDVNQFTFEE